MNTVIDYVLHGKYRVLIWIIISVVLLLAIALTAGTVLIVIAVLLKNKEPIKEKSKTIITEPIKKEETKTIESKDDTQDKYISERKAYEEYNKTYINYINNYDQDYDDYYDILWDLFYISEEFSDRFMKLAILYEYLYIKNMILEGKSDNNYDELNVIIQRYYDNPEYSGNTIDFKKLSILYNIMNFDNDILRKFNIAGGIKDAGIELNKMVLKQKYGLDNNSDDIMEIIDKNIIEILSDSKLTNMCIVSIPLFTIQFEFVNNEYDLNSIGKFINLKNFENITKQMYDSMIEFINNIKKIIENMEMFQNTNQVLLQYLKDKIDYWNNIDLKKLLDK